MYKKLYKLITILTLGLLIPLVVIGAQNNTLHDPTKPSSYSDSIVVNVPNQVINITAIFAGKDHKTVMIGDHPFTIGEKISGLTITDITADSIVLKNEAGDETKVTMPYTAVKQPITNNQKKNRENLD